MRWVAASFALACLFGGAAIPFRAAAELPPATYRDWQSRAPEVVEFEVVSVSTHLLAKNASDQHIDIKADAKVLKVERTETGIKPGAVICLQYDAWYASKKLAGGAPDPIVKSGDHVKAFLRRRDDGPCFAPAAASHSFIDLTTP